MKMSRGHTPNILNESLGTMSWAPSLLTFKRVINCCSCNIWTYYHTTETSNSNIMHGQQKKLHLLDTAKL